MLVLIVSLIALAAVTALATHLLSRGKESAPVKDVKTCGTCDGTNAKCEQDCMMEAATRDIVYYDDEELDRFKGKPSDGYTDDEAEQFREILYTMQQGEVAEWNRSLVLRGISLPDQIKDEVTLLIGG